MAWIDEAGCSILPICITNTHSVGVVRDAVAEFAIPKARRSALHLPVVAETWDGWLSDIGSFAVTKEHAWAATGGARARARSPKAMSAAAQA